MSAPVAVVVLVGSPAEPGHLIESALGQVTPANALTSALGAPALVSVVSWTAPLKPMVDIAEALSVGDLPPALIDRLLRAVGAPVIKRFFRKYPAGRLLNSMGPIDDSRVFWRAVRRSPKAMSVISAATIVIAADLPAVKTAWIARHTGGVPRAFYGLPAAISELAKASGS